MSENEMNQVARERADKRIDQAVGDLKAAARQIGRQYGIPEGISGHSTEELLGRMAYVPSMARDLRRAAGQELAKQELRRVLEAPPVPREIPQTATEASKINTPPRSFAPPSFSPPASTSAPLTTEQIPGVLPGGRDVADLSGLTVQTVKALKAAGLHTVADLAPIPDEHLEKVSGIGKKTVQQIRAAIAKASTPAGE
jgi:hypothetical protein